MSPRPLPHRATLLLLLLPLLTACSSLPRAYDQQELGPLPTIRFAVARVEVVDRSPEVGTSFIDRRRGRELARALARALRARVVAAGGPGAVRVVVERARLVERPLPRPEGLGALFTRDAVAELEAAATVRLSVMGEDGRERAFALVELARSRPLYEGTGVAAREAAARTLARRLVAATVRALARRAERDLAAWLTLGP